MFTFGDPESSAKMLMDSCLASGGPGIADAPIDEMSEEELRKVLAYAFMAVRRGISEGLDDQAMEVLVDWYDAAFVAVAEASEEFVELFRRGAVQVPYGPDDRDKYWILAGLSES